MKLFYRKPQVLAGYYWKNVPIMALNARERKFANREGWREQIPGSRRFRRLHAKQHPALAFYLRPDQTLCGMLVGIIEIRRAYYAAKNSVGKI